MRRRPETKPETSLSLRLRRRRALKPRLTLIFFLLRAGRERYPRLWTLPCNLVLCEPPKAKALGLPFCFTDGSANPLGVRRLTQSPQTSNRWVPTLEKTMLDGADFWQRFCRGHGVFHNLHMSMLCLSSAEIRVSIHNTNTAYLTRKTSPLSRHRSHTKHLCTHKTAQTVTTPHHG